MSGSDWRGGSPAAVGNTNTTDRVNLFTRNEGVCQHGYGMGYWGRVAKRAGKEATAAAGFGTVVRLMASVLVQAIIALLIYVLLGEAGLEQAAPMRLITAAAPFLTIPILFLIKLAAVPAAMHAEDASTIRDLEARLSPAGPTRREIGDQLFSFETDAKKISKRLKSKDPEAGKDSQAWISEARQYIKNNLGGVYVSKFDLDEGLPITAMPKGMIPKSEEWSCYVRLVKRLTRLRQIMEDFKAA